MNTPGVASTLINNFDHDSITLTVAIRSKNGTGLKVFDYENFNLCLNSHEYRGGYTFRTDDNFPGSGSYAIVSACNGSC
jgi:hypothetical protein